MGCVLGQVRDGRAVGVEPFEKDEHPSPLAQSQVAAVYDKSRIDRPYVRKGFLDRGAASDRTRRGAEPFVPVDWDTALDRWWPRELKRVKSSFGNALDLRRLLRLVERRPAAPCEVAAAPLHELASAARPCRSTPTPTRPAR